MKLKWLILASMVATAAAHANVYTLTEDGCTGTCGTGPFGTVTVTEPSVGQLDFTVALNAGIDFHATDDPQHHALVFDLVGNPTITIAGLPSPFTANGPQSAGTISAAPFGSFEYVINYPRPPVGSISSFSFSATAGGLTLGSLEPNANGVWFAVDITGTNGLTGNVAAIPEPEAYAMLLAGLGLLGFLARRRKR